jgi:hypothetical protein
MHTQTRNVTVWWELWSNGILCYHTNKLSSVNTCYELMHDLSTIFWDITPCSQLKVNRRFGGIYHLHLQVSKKLSKKPSWTQVVSRIWFLAQLIFFGTWRWRRHVTLKSRLTLNRLHDVISQKMVLYMNVNCVLGHKRESRILFQFIVSILWVMVV